MASSYNNWHWFPSTCEIVFRQIFIIFSLTNNLQKSSIILQSKIEILSSFLGTLRSDYFRQAKTAAKKEWRNWRLDLQHGASGHCSNWEVGRRNFEHEPTTESDGSFSWTGHAPSRVWRKRKRTNPIRSERHVVPACPHLTKTCSLSSETLQTNPQSSLKKNSCPHSPIYFQQDFSCCESKNNGLF